ncbi:SOS response-associated peptidase [Shewanella goraebulensis]|uniref:SOS response-associated peptidase n=1 Tax=Shewanella goraebulensis TaxID=3050637 RepID=UPI00254F3C1F|nr:SOS response-associated peptidase family protein [Shewanella goraebulensis]
MCGRMEVLLDGMKGLLDQVFDEPLSIQTNLDLRPSDPVTTLSSSQGKLMATQQSWGIQPTWSKKLIINAQAETVADKTTFASAFSEHRCIIPCSAWFEWRDEGQTKKQKYRFSHAVDKPLFMAGIIYPEQQQLVTLTIVPNEKCAEYHHRMPLFIPSSAIDSWLNDKPQQLNPLMQALPDKWIKVSAV